MAISAAIGVGKKIVGKAISVAKKKKKDLEKTKAGKKIKERVSEAAKKNDINSLHSIVYPDGFVLGSHSEDTQGATHVHKITHSHALRTGLPFIQVYKKFIDFIKKLLIFFL